MTIPFSNTGIAQYPPEGPMIGQERVRNKLKNFLSGPEDRGQGNLFIYGEWGSGKSRIGYQIVGEANRKAKGWLCEDDTNSEYKNQPLFKDLDQRVLPIRIRLSDFISEIDENSAAYHAFNEAVEQVIDGETDSSTDLREMLDEYGINQMSLQTARSQNTGPKNKFNAYTDVFYNEGDVDRVAIVVDEVEQVDSETDISPNDVDSSGVSRRRLQTFFEGLKRSVNHIDNEDAFDFILLTTSNLERTVNGIGGFKRRKKEIDLDKPTVEQALKLTGELANKHDFDVSDEMVKALFFASGNNFGWFTNAMHSMLLAQQDNPGASYADIIKNNPVTFNQIFQEDYLNLLIDYHQDEQVKNSISKVIYNIRPISCNFIDINVDDLSNIEAPDGIHPIGPMRAVDTNKSDLVSRLKKNEFDLESGSDLKLTFGGDEIMIADIEDVLEVFRLDNGQIGLYEREADLESLTEFLIQGTATPDTAEKVVSTLLEIVNETKNETTHLAPTIQFLTRWNKAWRNQRGVSRWLPEKQWEELNEEVEAIQGPGDQEVVEGFAYTRFGSDTELTTEYTLNVPSTTVDIANDSLVDTVESEQAVILHQPSQVEDIGELKDDLTKLRDTDKRPIAYVLFSSEQERRESREELREFLPSFDPFIIDHVVDDTDLTRTFLKRFSFVGNVFEFDSHVIGGHTGKGRYEDKKKLIRERDNQWRNEVDADGWLQRPLVPKSLERGTERYVAGLLQFMRGKDIREEIKGADSESVVTAWDTAWADADNLLIPVDEDTRSFKHLPQLPQLLNIIGEDGVTATSLSGKILYDKNGTVSINLAIKQTLDVLHRIGVIIERNDEFVVANSDSLKKLSDDATEKIESLRGKDDKHIAAFQKRMGQLVAGFRVTGDMIDNKLGDLQDEVQQIQLTDFEKLRKTDLKDPMTWCEIALTANRIQTETLRIHIPDKTFDAADATEYPDQFTADTDYKEYPISLRLEFLDWLDTHLNQETNDLLDEVQEKVTELETVYSECRGKAFPTAEIESVFGSIRDDLTFDQDTDIPDSLTAETDKTLQGHLNVVEVQEVFDRLQWYDKILSRGFTKNNPWHEFTTAYETMESILDEWDQYSNVIKSAQAYVDGSDTYEQDLRNSNVDISGSTGDKDTRTIKAEWPKIKKAIKNPKSIEDPAQSVIALHEDIEELERMLKRFTEHANQIIEEAKSELSNLKGDLRITTLESLASAVGEPTKVDVPDINSFDRYVDCKNDLQNIKVQIEDRGEELLRNAFNGGEACWPLYKQLHDLATEEITSEDIDDTERGQLEMLQKNGILSYDETIVYHVSLN